MSLRLRQLQRHTSGWILSARPITERHLINTSFLFARRRTGSWTTTPGKPYNTMAAEQQTDANRSFLREHMAQYQGENYVEGWSKLWKNKAPDEQLPWDRGFPNPALEDTLVEKRAIIGGPLIEGASSEGNRNRKKALVPGCGSGYDVLLLASFGYDAYGLEYSDAALEVCKQEEARNRDKYPVRDPAIGRGKTTFVQGDFFKDDWLEKLGLQRNSFDLIYDYTVCTGVRPVLSIPPSPPPVVVLKTGFRDWKDQLLTVAWGFGLCSSSVHCNHLCVPNGPFGIPNFSLLRLVAT
jgi:SAM-dependent methyltransferase